jgi:hypothetical protein
LTRSRRTSRACWPGCARSCGSERTTSVTDVGERECSAPPISNPSIADSPAWLGAARPTIARRRGVGAQRRVGQVSAGAYRRVTIEPPSRPTRAPALREHRPDDGGRWCRCQELRLPISSSPAGRRR